METELLSAQERERLENYLQRHSAPAESPRITRRHPTATVPLTFAQQQVWLHAQLAPDSPTYNEPFTVHRHGPLDIRALERSFTEIIRRHEAWRTSFPVVNGEPIQRIQPPFDIKLPLTDLRNVPEAGRLIAALELAGKDARQPFDLAKGPPFRAQLVQLADEEYRLFVTCHHLIFDGITGYQVFLPELIALYNAFSTAGSVSLPELPFQYGDYAVWEKTADDREIQRRNLAYWQKQLAGPLPVLELPTDRPSTTLESFRGAMQSFSVSPQLTSALRALSAECGVTLFTTLVAGLQTLLLRYSGQEDILIGTISAGRNYPGTEKLLGFFLNTIVLRTDLSGDPGFAQLMRRVRDVIVDALSHDGVPLNDIVKEVHPDRHALRDSLFRVLVSLEPSLPPIEAGWNLTAIDVETGTSKFDLCLVLDDRPQGLSGRIIYSTDLFDPSTIAQMIECWQVLLQSVAADPQQRLSKLPILPERQREQLLVEWNQTETQSTFIPVHHRFEAVAARSPQTVAVKCGSQVLTYAELHQRAESLSSYLRSKGVRAEVPVALCLERSVEMIVAILAVLKAGGAYVPLDPGYPSQRLRSLLDDCQAPLLVTQQRLQTILPSTSANIVCLDAGWPEITATTTNAARATSPEDLAYVIYTSGSTGEPKGVEITHGNLSHSTTARFNYYRDHSRVFLLLSPISFDSSVATIFHALCSGATLVIPPADFKWQGQQICNLIAQEQVTSLLCVPSLYTEMLQTPDPQALNSLRRVIVAGEACPRQLVSRHAQVLPQAKLFNEYGPTEATVWATAHQCEDTPGPAAAAIGRPVADTQAYVLDRNRELLPVGVPGELYLAGPGIGRGYRNRRDLTAERFLPNPYRPASRLYKTGDIVRYLPDGNLQFIGRVDEQVKFRGLRIELGEIEAVLGQHPDVLEAAVVVANDQKPRLHAFVAIRQQYATSAAELREFLKSRLPNYMVPAVFTIVEALPRTSNLKLDRLKLSEQAEKAIRAHAPASDGVRDDTEVRLLKIWKEVLELDNASDITQDFFELGGHSLLAAKLLYHIEQEFHQSLSLAFIFQAPTVEMMADALRAPNQSLRARAIVEIQPNGSRPPLFCVRAGPRFRLLAQKLGLDQPFLGVDIPYSDAIKLPTPYRLEDIAAFLIQAMREVQPHGPYYLAGLCVNAVIAYEVARQLRVAGEEISLLALFDGHNGAYYKHPLRDGRYTGRIKYHLANLLQLDLRESSAYIFERLEEARRKLERTMWLLSAEQGNARGGKLRNTDSIIHPAFHRYEPGPYPGNMVLFQSSDWPVGEYFNFALGWKDLVQGDLKFHQIPGDHPSMFREPHVNSLAAQLRTYLELSPKHPSSEPVSANLLSR